MPTVCLSSFTEMGRNQELEHAAMHLLPSFLEKGKRNELAAMTNHPDSKDLSNNSISCLNGDIFKGLDSLSRLVLLPRQSSGTRGRCRNAPDAPLELPSFQLTPSQRQVVFQGDSLPFQCQASLVAEDMQVLWYQNGRMVKPDATRGIFIEKRIVQNCSLIAR
ncbi:hypothetical protein GOODEAATRI_007317 [Goodea atripinnis]|uniref:Ig-like domain-containing protein n=1 Tax=Goodea atripinnis TaxID=208336 RepID=A0ABV0NV06_9TELE